MRRAGLLLWEAHQVAAAQVKPGVTTAAINDAVEAFLAERGATPLFKGVPGVVPFPAATCVSVNEAVVHGMPGSRRLREGDIVSLDIGVRLDGWCADAAVTYAVGPVSPLAQRLLEVTEGALALAIQLVGEKSTWSQVARELQAYVEDAGFSVVEALVGHSIGQEMWEGLQLPNHYTREFERQGDFPLQPGLVLAIEPMVNAGTKAVHTLPDHWTVVTDDGLPSAHFEHTVALTKEGPRVLTCGPNGEGWGLG
ncbi:MAG: type I methionyl aminopeptidase [Armatimonadetes bacterium]|nr:type I methionyl aminopeptidase [Armatimonadota bacterium]